MYEQRLDQIVGNWGQFESVMSQPAGRGATVDFRFRNAKQVEFVAHEVDVRKLLDDVKAYLKSKPKQLEWEQMNIADIGYRLVQEDQKKYIGAEVARWKLDLEPREKHFDKRITVTTPLQKAGAYLVTAKVADGNTSQIVLWLADTAIVRKPMTDKSFYFVADAVTGAPIDKANVEFFGYRQKHIDGNNYQIDTKNFAELTDANGETFLPIPDDDKDAGRPRIPMARHRHDESRPPRLPRLPQRLAQQLLRRRIQRSQNVHHHRPARLPPGPDGAVQVLGPPAPSTMPTTNPSSPTSRSPSKSTIPRARRSTAKRSPPTTTAASPASSSCPATRRSASTSSSSSTAAAARSASRNTRSPSSK